MRCCDLNIKTKKGKHKKDNLQAFTVTNIYKQSTGKLQKHYIKE